MLVVPASADVRTDSSALVQHSRLCRQALQLCPVPGGCRVTWGQRGSWACPPAHAEGTPIQNRRCGVARPDSPTQQPGARGLARGEEQQVGKAGQALIEEEEGVSKQ